MTRRSAELIEWAHIIDGALYESPAQCVELRTPALKLMQVIEGEKDPCIRRDDHPPSDRRSRSTTSSRAARYRPSSSLSSIVIGRHVNLIKERANYSRGVVSFDLTDTQHRRLQQVHSLLFLSGDDLQRRAHAERIPHKDLGRIKPLVAASAAAQYRRDLREIRRRRSRGCRSGQFETERTSS